MTDLETAIRSALQARADAVPVRHTSVVKRRHRWLPPALAAAVVIALVAVGVVVLRDRSTPPAPSTAAQVVGWRWRVVQVHDRQGPLAVPASFRAEIQFDSAGQVGGSDGVNYLGAHYRLTGAGYTLGDVTSTAAGYAGHDPVMVRTVAAVDAAFPNRGSVGAAVQGTTLTLTVPSAVLTLTRVGRVRPGPAPSPTTPVRPSGPS